MEQSRVLLLLLSLDRMPVHSRVTPPPPPHISSLIPVKRGLSIPVHTPGWRELLEVLSLKPLARGCLNIIKQNNLLILRMILKWHPSHVADKQDYSTTPLPLAPTFDFTPSISKNDEVLISSKLII